MNKCTELKYKEFVELRDKCSLCGMNNFNRNLGRLEMKSFLKQFDKRTQEEMFERDNKETKWQN